MIRSASEVGENTAKSGNKTWKFKMKQSRDFAFAASPAFILDAARINLPSGKSHWLFLLIRWKATGRVHGADLRNIQKLLLSIILSNGSSILIQMQ